ncbi:hypothetical protein SNEBB_008599 [Seison nebaliae]|nr:hypothetical protein SNEBB_008599 [Seison nebaliae]
MNFRRTIFIVFFILIFIVVPILSTILNKNSCYYEYEILITTNLSQSTSYIELSLGSVDFMDMGFEADYFQKQIKSKHGFIGYANTLRITINCHDQSLSERMSRSIAMTGGSPKVYVSYPYLNIDEQNLETIYEMQTSMFNKQFDSDEDCEFYDYCTIYWLAPLPVNRDALMAKISIRSNGLGHHVQETEFILRVNNFPNGLWKERNEVSQDFIRNKKETFKLYSDESDYSDQSKGCKLCKKLLDRKTIRFPFLNLPFTSSESLIGGITPNSYMIQSFDYFRSVTFYDLIPLLDRLKREKREVVCNYVKDDSDGNNKRILGTFNVFMSTFILTIYGIIETGEERPMISLGVCIEKIAIYSEPLKQAQIVAIPGWTKSKKKNANCDVYYSYVSKKMDGPVFWYRLYDEHGNFCEKFDLEKTFQYIVDAVISEDMVYFIGVHESEGKDVYIHFVYRQLTREWDLINSRIVYDCTYLYQIRSFSAKHEFIHIQRNDCDEVFYVETLTDDRMSHSVLFAYGNLLLYSLDSGMSWSLIYAIADDPIISFDTWIDGQFLFITKSRKLIRGSLFSWNLKILTYSLHETDNWVISGLLFDPIGKAYFLKTPIDRNESLVSRSEIPIQRLVLLSALEESLQQTDQDIGSVDSVSAMCPLEGFRVELQSIIHSTIDRKINYRFRPPRIYRTAQFHTLKSLYYYHSVMHAIIERSNFISPYYRSENSDILNPVERWRQEYLATEVYDEFVSRNSEELDHVRIQLDDYKKSHMINVLASDEQAAIYKEHAKTKILLEQASYDINSDPYQLFKQSSLFYSDKFVLENLTYNYLDNSNLVDVQIAKSEQVQKTAVSTYAKLDELDGGVEQIWANQFAYRKQESFYTGDLDAIPETIFLDKRKTFRFNLHFAFKRAFRTFNRDILNNLRLAIIIPRKSGLTHTILRREHLSNLTVSYEIEIADRKDGFDEFMFPEEENDRDKRHGLDHKYLLENQLKYDWGKDSLHGISFLEQLKDEHFSRQYRRIHQVLPRDYITLGTTPNHLVQFGKQHNYLRTVAYLQMWSGKNVVCVDTDGRQLDSKVIHIIRGCPPSQRLVLDIARTREPGKKRQEFVWQCGLNGDSPAAESELCLYYGYNFRPQFKLLDTASDKLKDFNEKLIVKVVGVHINPTLDTWEPVNVSELSKEDVYKINLMDGYRLFDFSGDELATIEGYPIYSASRSGIKWNCQYKSICNDVVPQKGQSPQILLLLEFSNKGLNHSGTYCKYSIRFRVRLFGLPLQKGLSYTVILMTFLVLLVGLLMFCIFNWIRMKFYVEKSPPTTQKKTVDSSKVDDSIGGGEYQVKLKNYSSLTLFTTKHPLESQDGQQMNKEKMATIKNHLISTEEHQQKATDRIWNMQGVIPHPIIRPIDSPTAKNSKIPLHYRSITSSKSNVAESRGKLSERTGQELKETSKMGRRGRLTSGYGTSLGKHESTQRVESKMFGKNMEYMNIGAKNEDDQKKLNGEKSSAPEDAIEKMIQPIIEEEVRLSEKAVEKKYEAPQPSGRRKIFHTVITPVAQSLGTETDSYFSSNSPKTFDSSSTSIDFRQLGMMQSDEPDKQSEGTQTSGNLKERGRKGKKHGKRGQRRSRALIQIKRSFSEFGASITNKFQGKTSQIDVAAKSLEKKKKKDKAPKIDVSSKLGLDRPNTPSRSEYSSIIEQIPTSFHYDKRNLKRSKSEDKMFVESANPLNLPKNSILLSPRKMSSITKPLEKGISKISAITRKPKVSPNELEGIVKVAKISLPMDSSNRPLNRPHQVVGEPNKFLNEDEQEKKNEKTKKTKKN